MRTTSREQNGGIEDLFQQGCEEKSPFKVGVVRTKPNFGVEKVADNQNLRLIAV